MKPVKRDQTIVLVIVGVAVALALSRRVVTAQTLLLFGAAVPSIILHEVSHGIVALYFGDDTAKRAGRLTLNPIAHVDLFGTIILPALLSLSGLGVFGYAKPVPINPSRMRHPRDDAVVVSLAGPATNVLLAVIAAVVLRQQHPSFIALDSGPWRIRIPFAFGIINVVLAVFNLIPFPPLDGSAVIDRFVPKAWRSGWESLRRYGVLILVGVALLLPGALSRLFTPAITLWERIIAP